MQFVVAGLMQCQQVVSQRIVEGSVVLGKQPGLLRLAQVDKGGINAVQAGAGH